MGKARVLILGHSFIRRLHEFITRSHDNEYTSKLGISTPEFVFKWHGVGSRTIAKVLKYDLSVVKEFGPDITILQLGTNDLVNSSPFTVGSSLEHLVTLLHDDYKVDLICVCQTLRRSSLEALFNKNAGLLTRYLKTVLEPIPYAFTAFGLTGNFGNQRVHSCPEMAFIWIVGGNINFIVVYEGQCSDACVYLMTFKVLFLNTGRQFRDPFSWLLLLYCVRSCRGVKWNEQKYVLQPWLLK